MHPFAVAVPDVEVPRSDVVAARIARKLGPLFGVVWEQNPFGCTWVCDFGALTLAEIARGAPYPTRDVQAAFDLDGASTGGAHEAGARGGSATREWRLADRAVWTPQRGPTPGAITHATLNRYGPDTKAAVVLVGANRLLRDVTAAIAWVCRSLADQQVAPEIRIAAWASLVLEAFRGQPALVAAAVQARAIQHALTTPWGEHLWLRGLETQARCEFGMTGVAGRDAVGPGADDDPLRPVGFELVDGTLPLLRLPMSVTDGPLIGRGEVLDDIATRWCRRLLQTGSPGRGITWVAEDRAGHQRVHSYVPTGSLVAPFVAEVLALFSIADDAGSQVCLKQVSGLLSGVDTAGLSLLAWRAHLFSTHAITSYLRSHDGPAPVQRQVRETTRELCNRAAEEAVKWLGREDPATVLLVGYAAYLHAWDISLEPTADLSIRASAATELVGHLDRMVDAWRHRLVDPGTASCLLEVGAMALNRLRVPSFESRLPELWRAAMQARGIDPDADLDDPLALPAPQQYHLQNYAAFLASAAESVQDLRRALAAQLAYVRVQGQVLHGEPAAFTSARTSRQAAAAIAGRLVRALTAADAAAKGTAEYREVLAEGVVHARAALASPTAAALLGEIRAEEQADVCGGPDVTLLAIAVLPVIFQAWADQQADAASSRLVDDALLAAADALLATALNSVDQLGSALSEAARADLADLHRRRHVADSAVG